MFSLVREIERIFLKCEDSQWKHFPQLYEMGNGPLSHFATPHHGSVLSKAISTSKTVQAKHILILPVPLNIITCNNSFRL